MKSKGKASQRVAQAPPKPTRRLLASSSTSSGTGGSDDEPESRSGSKDGGGGDRAKMLAALQAHSRALLGIDGPEDAESSTHAQKRLKRSNRESDDQEEGFEDGDMEEYQTDDGWGAEDDFVSDSEDGLSDIALDTDQLPTSKVAAAAAAMVGGAVSGRKVPEVVYAPQTSSNTDILSKAERRAFLVCPLCHFLASRMNEYVKSDR